MKLYLPEKYRVTLGKGVHIGLCTVWSDPDIVIKQAPQLLDTCAIIGTLYSKEGVNIMLRNLCMNPQITYVLVWGKNPLSHTPTGKSGWSVLTALWNNGISADGTVNTINYKLHANMDFSVVIKVTQNVQLIDVSNLELEEVLEITKKLDKREPYMEPISFPVYQPEAGDALPSEEVGWVVRGNRIADVWIKTIDRVIRYGEIKMSEYGSKMRELPVITWVCEDEDLQNPFIPEDWPGELRSIIGLENKEHIDAYIKNVFYESELPESTSYTYGQRLRAYPSEGKIIDQVGYIVKKMKEFGTSRRAFAILWHPAIDQGDKSPPCITQIHVLQGGGNLHLFAVVRSQDMFKAALLNAFGLRALQEEIANDLGMKAGKLSITTNSAHIYEDDWDNAKKLVQCAIWDRPSADKFEEDPRGNVLVRIENGKLVSEVVTKDGKLISKIEGTTAREVCTKLSDLDLLSSPRHYTDIARQLQKAEISRDLGIKFEQDKPLKLYSKNDDKEIDTAFR